MCLLSDSETTDHLVRVDHVDLALGGRPGALEVVDARDAQVLVHRGDHVRQLLDVLVDDSETIHTSLGVASAGQQRCI